MLVPLFTTAHDFWCVSLHLLLPQAMAHVDPVKSWNSIPLSKVFNLYVTVVTAGLEKQRGLQMLVFLDHIAPLMVQSLEQDKAYLQLGSLVGGLRNLARACESARRCVTALCTCTACMFCFVFYKYSML